MTIREDFHDVFRCYNHPLGEFYLGQDNAQRVNRFARRFEFTVEQAAKEFGLEKLSLGVQNKFRQGGAALFETIEICHLVEENSDDGIIPGATARWRELYWEASASDAATYLKVLPLYEWLAITPRWELIGSDSYGVSPAMDCLSDVRELQQLKLERAQGLQKQVRPPLIVDMQMKNRPKALSAGGITYAAMHSQNFGAKEAYKVNLPYGELRMDIEELKRSIRETCKNDLFNMISQLDTVRSATEIDARREEKLIHLGSVFDRFTTEGSDIILKRIFGIAQRAGLLPEAPPELDGLDVDVQYVSVLSDAQRASSTIAIERYFQLAGNLVGVWPEAKDILNVEELMREYSEGIGVSPKGNRSRDDLVALKAQQDQMAQAAQMAQIGSALAGGAKTLSETNVGGGVSALQALI
jgi:hypothetical protein